MKSNLEIALRNGTSLVIVFTDDEVVNSVSEKLKKAIMDPNGIFSVDMKDQNGATTTHFVPGREIIRYSLIPLPPVAVPA